MWEMHWEMKQWWRRALPASLWTSLQKAKFSLICARYSHSRSYGNKCIYKQVTDIVI